MESSVEFRIGGLGARATSTRDVLPFAVIDHGDVVIRCPPGSGESLNDKLVWLWGVLKHQRRKLKSLQAEGVSLCCHCKVPRGPITLQPNAAEFLHLVGASLIVTTGTLSGQSSKRTR